MLRTGDRVELSGGYALAPPWLATMSSLTGRVARFIPGQNDQPAAVVHLDQPLRAEGVTGSILVLQLRYRGGVWKDSGVVHIELCDFEPEPKPWHDRSQGKWIEAAASYRKRCNGPTQSAGRA